MHHTVSVTAWEVKSAAQLWLLGRLCAYVTVVFVAENCRTSAIMCLQGVKAVQNTASASAIPSTRHELVCYGYRLKYKRKMVQLLADARFNYVKKAVLRDKCGTYVKVESLFRNCNSDDGALEIVMKAFTHMRHSL